MKSIAKVITQKHIKEIPSFMFGFRGRGFMFHRVENPSKIASQKDKRAIRKHTIRNQSRKANRA